MRLQPTNPLVGPLMTDKYQLTMAYGYWKNGRHEHNAVFDLFFRRCPFGGEFAVFAGLEEILRFVDSFRFSGEDIDYVRSIMQGCDAELFDWLASVNCDDIDIFAPAEGTLIFPRVPLLRVEGPLAVAQLLETPLLTLTNYATLVATNAARMRLAAGRDKTLAEFGLRRAQGPDGGVSASRYSFIGGFDSTSNVLAGKLFGIPVGGTHAHAYVQSYSSLDEIKDDDFKRAVLAFRKLLGFTNTNDGELAAFISYAKAFPDAFLALVDTYDTLKSGVPNFICVAMALEEQGFEPLGIRLDSGDLAYLSKEARKMFAEAWAKFGERVPALKITASNEIDEAVIHQLNRDGHEIDMFGIGTNLVTCETQPSLGGVYKLVEINGRPRIKLSNQVAKMTLPGRKAAFRLIGREGYPLVDLMLKAGEQPPRPGERILCRDPFDETKRAYVTPANVIRLHQHVWRGGVEIELPSLVGIRNFVMQQLDTMRPDHIRPTNPTPYKVSVSQGLYDFIRQLLSAEAPVEEIT